MPATIMFNAPDFSDLEVSVLTHTWETNCKDLGIWDKDFIARVSKVHFDNVSLYGRTGMPSPNRFLVELNSNKFNLFDATACLGHETVHIKQHLVGDLVDDPNGVKWKNTLYSALLLPFYGNDVPWEYEAWDKMGALHKHAFACLPPDEQRLLDKSQSNGLVLTWDENYHPWRD